MNLQAINQSLVKLSIQIENKDLSLEKAAILAENGGDAQNNAAELKHRASRKAGEVLNKIEQKEGWKSRKKTQKDLNIPFNISRRWQKEALVQKTDFEKYLKDIRQKNKEITNTGVARAGKESKKLTHHSIAERVILYLETLTKKTWLHDLSIKDYSGSREDLEKVAALLENFSKQFAATAKTIREIQSGV